MSTGCSRCSSLAVSCERDVSTGRGEVLQRSAQESSCETSGQVYEGKQL